MQTPPTYEIVTGRDELDLLQTQLNAPFPVDFHSFKPSATSRDKTKALCVPFVDSRHYQDRLDAVDPAWTSSLEILNTPKMIVVVCTVRVLGRSRSSTGDCDLSDTNTVTSAEAQAFKRACAAHGIGRYLYHLPKWWVEYDGQRITDRGHDDLLNKLAYALGDETPNATSRPTSHATASGAPTPTSTPTESTAATRTPAGEQPKNSDHYTPTAFWKAGNSLIGTRFPNREALQDIVAANTGSDGMVDWMRAIAALA